VLTLILLVHHGSALESIHYSYANLFLLFLHEYWTNHGQAEGIWDLWVCTFEPSSWYLDIFSVGEMVLSKQLAPQKDILCWFETSKLWEFP
jgi:hypothetical protein